MKKLFLFLFLIFNIIQCYSQKNYHWDYFVKPILDSISSVKNKKIYFYKVTVLKEKKVLSCDSILHNFYNLDSTEIHYIIESSNLNRGKFSKKWKNGISNKKKRRIDNKWHKNKSLIVSVSFPVFIKKDIYLLEITYHCPGLCGYSNLYFIRVDKINKTFKIEHIKKFGGA